MLGVFADILASQAQLAEMAFRLSGEVQRQTALEAAYSLFQSPNSPLVTHRESLFGPAESVRLEALQHQLARERSISRQARKRADALEKENIKLKAELAAKATPKHSLVLQQLRLLLQ